MTEAEAWEVLEHQEAEGQEGPRPESPQRVIRPRPWCCGDTCCHVRAEPAEGGREQMVLLGRADRPEGLRPSPVSSAVPAASTEAPGEHELLIHYRPQKSA